MKALKGFLKFKNFAGAMALMGLLAGCGSDDNRTGGAINQGPGTAINPIATGPGLLPVMEGQPISNQLNTLITQTPCMGVNPVRQLIAVNNLGAPVPVNNLNFSNYQTIAAGKNPFGDIAIIVDYGPQTQTLIMSSCARDYVGPVQSITGSNLVINISQQCTINEISSGTIFLNGFEPVLIQPINIQGGMGMTPVPGLCS